MDSRRLAQWIALHHTPGLGARLYSRLRARLGDLDAIFGASPRELGAILGDKTDTIAALGAGVGRPEVERAMDWLARSPAHHVLPLEDPAYPALLREIPDPPLLLYVRGDVQALGRPQLAVVGSRNPTPGGARNARVFAAALARCGLGIVSGLALGIDAAAHRGALAAEGLTLAVAGTGVDVVYPPAHRALAEQIVQQGALLSEFALGTGPRRAHFPRRNRLISGLSLGTLVVEAALHSGSLITAHLAADQGREVFALPGSIHSPLSRGCHRLLREGAKLVETGGDILEELGPLAGLVLQGGTRDDEASTTKRGASGQHGEILKLMGRDPVTVDTLVERSGLTPEAISSMLLHMELQGIVESHPGGRYLRV